MDTADEVTIRAAGAVLWRRRNGVPEPEFAVVHRPRYDDWSLPKGKVDGGETLPAAAVREVREETGVSAVLGRRLGTVHYPVSYRGARVGKSVDYYAARAATDDGFTPDHEVDELRWISFDDAGMLTYGWDRDLLARFIVEPADPPTLLLVRHAKAGSRTAWTDDDDLRPLTGPGRRQADALRPLLRLFGADRVHAVPMVRCRDTVRPLADDLAVDMAPEPLLSEQEYRADPPQAYARLAEIVAAGGTPAVCSQGGVIPDLLRTLAVRSGLDLGEPPPSKKGSVWVLSFRPDSVGAETGRPAELRLLAADYVADPER